VLSGRDSAHRIFRGRRRNFSLSSPGKHSCCSLCYSMSHCPLFVIRQRVLAPVPNTLQIRKTPRTPCLCMNPVLPKPLATFKAPAPHPRRRGSPQDSRLCELADICDTFLFSTCCRVPVPEGLTDPLPKLVAIFSCPFPPLQVSPEGLRFSSTLRRTYPFHRFFSPFLSTILVGPGNQLRRSLVITSSPSPHVSYSVVLSSLRSDIDWPSGCGDPVGRRILPSLADFRPLRLFSAHPLSRFSSSAAPSFQS